MAPYPQISTGGGGGGGLTESEVDARISTFIDSESFDDYLGTVGAAPADHQAFPASDAGGYVIGLNNSTVNGVAVEVGRVYRCRVNNTAAGTAGNWDALPVNVLSISLPEGSIPAADASGGFEASGAQMIRAGGDQALLLASSTMLETQGLALSDAAQLGSISSLLNIRNNITDDLFEVIDHRANRTEVADPPSWFDYEATETSTTEIYPNGAARFPLASGVSFEWSPNFTGRIWELEFRVNAAITNLRIRVSDVDSGVPALHWPNLAAWETGEGGEDITGTGAQRVNLDPNPLFDAAPTLNYRIEMRGDSGRLAGSGSRPCFKIIRQVGVRRVLQNRGGDNYLGDLGGTSAAFQTWPAANEGDYVITKVNANIAGRTVVPNQHYRCTADDSAEGDSTNWERVPFPRPAENVTIGDFPITDATRQLASSNLRQSSDEVLVERSENTVILSDQTQNTSLSGSANTDWTWTADREYEINRVGVYAQARAGEQDVQFRMVSVHNVGNSTDIWANPNNNNVTFEGADAEFRYFELGEMVEIAQGDEIRFRAIFASADVFHAPNSPSAGVSTAVRETFETRIADQRDLENLPESETGDGLNQDQVDDRIEAAVEGIPEGAIPEIGAENDFRNSNLRILGGPIVNVRDAFSDDVREAVTYAAPVGTESSPPTYPHYGDEDANVFQVYGGFSSSTVHDISGSGVSFGWRPNIAARILAVQFFFQGQNTNVRVRLIEQGTGRAVGYFPSKTVWDSGQGGPDFNTGSQNIEMTGYPSWMQVQPSTAYTVTIRADSGEVNGWVDTNNDPLPIFRVRRQVSEDRTLATISDLGPDQSGTIANQTGRVFDLSENTRSVRLELSNFRFAQDTFLWLRMRRSGQSAVDTGAAAYAWVRLQQRADVSTGNTSSAGDNADDRLRLTSPIDATVAFNMQIKILGAHTPNRTSMFAKSFFQAPLGHRVNSNADGDLLINGAIDQIQIGAGNGTMSGDFDLWEDR